MQLQPAYCHLSAGFLNLELFVNVRFSLFKYIHREVTILQYPIYVKQWEEVRSFIN